MDRRAFLRSLATLGASVCIPLEALAAATESAIDAAWKTAIQEPITFYVSTWGTLSYSQAEIWPQSRGQLLGISRVGNHAELLTLAREQGRIDGLLERAWEDRTAEDEESTIDSDWQTWLAIQPEETIHEFIALANEWIEDNADEFDWEVANFYGFSAQGAARSYFAFEFEYCNDFGIAIVDGDHPGSSYYAAELRMDVHDANVLAEELNLPIRFAWSGD
ncbi:hypothetical protein PTW32_16005 [Dechloromonas agitata]|uniref:hypothetical protein n=1 Tax=Dechloromonas agitata TaxID=73030 RepID=UPI00237E20ED|nr:hypothetical protein [Dechloromonas agitata]MDE1546921.1 hypothetical protein [Dechloromonas agitata]